MALQLRRLGGPHTSRLNALLPNSVPIRTILPAVTCSVQATYLTGRLPASHGIVGNGWYFRELGEVMFWRQSNQLVQGDKLWDEARRRDPGFTVANTFWWYAMNTGADITLTPRPLYCADGRKLPDCYSAPLALRDRFNREFGQFPLFQFWGPATSIASSEWIGKAAMAIEEEFHRRCNSSICRISITACRSTDRAGLSNATWPRSTACAARCSTTSGNEAAAS